MFLGLVHTLGKRHSERNVHGGDYVAQKGPGILTRPTCHFSLSLSLSRKSGGGRRPLLSLMQKPPVTHQALDTFRHFLLDSRCFGAWNNLFFFFHDRASTKHSNPALSVSKKTAWHTFRGHAPLLVSARGPHSLTISGSLVSKTNKQKRWARRFCL